MDCLPNDQMPATLDPSVLETIRSWYLPEDPDPVPDLTEAFVEDATTRLAALRQAALQGDSTLASQAAHSLKGMCGAIGAMRMNALSLQLEHTVQDDAGAVGTLVGTLEREFACVQIALRAFLKAC
jgi:HPt (histidine-containing phosphotransfer) domain-containing protein